MRLFIGIRAGCEKYLGSLQQMLKKAGNGNFTLSENLHITLKFLGEVSPSRLGDLRSAITEADGSVFTLECQGMAMLGKGGIVTALVGGDLSALSALFSRLEDALEKRGFEREARPFHPHITLVRNFHALEGDDIASMAHKGCRFKAAEVTLFESRREAGRLVYAPLFAHPLAPPPDA
jgi:RNA 2',3'-cyclic 3'-phosphodiesterase